LIIVLEIYLLIEELVEISSLLQGLLQAGEPEQALDMSLVKDQLPSKK
jgi:hypothetical protein